MIKGILIGFGIVVGIGLSILIMMGMSADYYEYKLADMNSGYALPEYNRGKAFVRVIMRMLRMKVEEY